MSIVFVYLEAMAGFKAAGAEIDMESHSEACHIHSCDAVFQFTPPPGPGGGIMTSSASVPQEEQPVVFIIDDDLSVRQALEALMRSVDLKAECFLSAQEFLERAHRDSPGCIVLDIRMPGMSGLEFQTALLKSGIDLPIIFITGHGDIPMTVQAMRSGAIEFLTKPLDTQALLDAIQAGLERDRIRRILRRNF
jgi:CheY-like chemotaxis protein